MTFYVGSGTLATLAAEATGDGIAAPAAEEGVVERDTTARVVRGDALGEFTAVPAGGNDSFGCRMIDGPKKGYTGFDDGKIYQNPVDGRHTARSDFPSPS